MVVKGLIKSIDYNGNTCTVRLPVFESAATDRETIITAIIATQPGIYNGYKVGDVVIVSFENNDIDMPIVLGKLYLGADIESKDPRGAINAANIKSSTPISIPVDTKLTLDNDPANLSTVAVDGDLSSYKSIADIIKGLKKQETQLGSINIRMIDDGENIGAEIARLDEENNLQTSRINQNAESIIQEVSRATAAESGIETAAYSKIEHTAEEIKSEVKETTDALSEDIEGVATAHSELVQTVNGISAEVSEQVTRIDTAISNIKDINDDISDIGDNISNINSSITTIETNISKLEQTATNIKAEVATKVDTVNNGTDEETHTKHGFGWDLNSDNWTVKAYDLDDSSDLPPEGLDIFKITRDSVKINTPSVVLAGYPTSVKTVYLSVAQTDPAPTDESEGWSETMPDHADGYYIWSATQTTVYEYNESNETWSSTTTISNITCTAGLDAYDSAKEAKEAADAAQGDATQALTNADAAQGTATQALTNAATAQDTATQALTNATTAQSTAEDAADAASAAQTTANAGYTLAQGKSTNYYTPYEPYKADPAPGGYYSAPDLKKGDCWFDTSYNQISPTPTSKDKYVGKYIRDPEHPEQTDKYIQVTADNINSLNISYGTTACYTYGELKQCKSVNETTHLGEWEDIGGELVLSKLTADYINALEITTNAISVLQTPGTDYDPDTNPYLFYANANLGQVTIAGFEVNNTSLHNGDITDITNYADDATGIYIGTDGIILREEDDDQNINEVKIDDGKLIANNADISGTIHASSGSIGGYEIDANRLYSEALELSDDTIKLGKYINSGNTSYSLEIQGTNGSATFAVNKDLLIESVGSSEESGILIAKDATRPWGAWVSIRWTSTMKKVSGCGGGNFAQVSYEAKLASVPAGWTASQCPISFEFKIYPSWYAQYVSDSYWTKISGTFYPDDPTQVIQSNVTFNNVPEYFRWDDIENMSWAVKNASGTYYEYDKDNINQWQSYNIRASGTQTIIPGTYSLGAFLPQYNGKNVSTINTLGNDSFWWSKAYINTIEANILNATTLNPYEINVTNTITARRIGTSTNRISTSYIDSLDTSSATINNVSIKPVASGYVDTSVGSGGANDYSVNINVDSHLIICNTVSQARDSTPRDTKVTVVMRQYNSTTSSWYWKVTINRGNQFWDGSIRLYYLCFNI